MKIQFILLFQLFVTILIAQTSNDEYKYIVDGYQQEQKHDLGPKEGYFFKPLQKEVSVDYPGKPTMKTKGLYKREGSNTKLVAIMLEYYKVNANKDKISEKYFCIPHPKSSKALFDKAFNAVLKTNDIVLLKIYNLALYSLTSEFCFK